MKLKTIRDKITEAIIANQLSSIKELLQRNGISLDDAETGQPREWADIMDDIGEKWETLVE